MILHIYLDKFRIRGGGLAKCPGATEGGAEFSPAPTKGKTLRQTACQCPTSAEATLRER